MFSIQEIALPVYGIKVVLDGNGSGTISSDLHDKDEDQIYKAAIDALESMVLACACAGIDIRNNAFLYAIETTADAIFNNCCE